MAMAEGLIDSDAYLEAWTWSELAEREGSPRTWPRPWSRSWPRTGGGTAGRGQWLVALQAPGHDDGIVTHVHLARPRSGERPHRPARPRRQQRHRLLPCAAVGQMVEEASDRRLRRRGSSRRPARRWRRRCRWRHRPRAHRRPSRCRWGCPTGRRRRASCAAGSRRGYHSMVTLEPMPGVVGASASIWSAPASRKSRPKRAVHSEPGSRQGAPSLTGRARVPGPDVEGRSGRLR